MILFDLLFLIYFRTIEQEENPPDDKSVDKDTPDRDNLVEVDQINDKADKITAEEDEAENEEQEFAVESEVAQTETTDIADKDNSSELVCQKVQTADECSNEVNRESIKEKSESKKIDECLEDKTETDVSESPSEQTEMQVDTVPKTNVMLDEPIDEDNAFEADLESAKKESSKKSDPENEDEKHPEASCLVESGSVGENKMNTSIDSIEDKPPETTASLDTDTLENENQTENQKENDGDEQNSKEAYLGEEAHDESDLEKTEAVADIESEKSGGSEEDETGKIGDVAEKESERPKLYQVHVL